MLSVMTIVTAAIVPVYGSSMANMQLRSVQNDFVALLAFVQERAVSDSREYRLYLNEQDRTYWVMYLAGKEDDEKLFEPVTEAYGKVHYLPEWLTLGRSKKLRKDRHQDAYYIACFPNGVCDRVELSFKDERSRDTGFKIITLGAMGKIKVERQ